MSDLKLENFELKLKIKKLELEIKEIRAELQRSYKNVFENNISENNVSEDNVEVVNEKYYKPFGSGKKRDREILIALAESNGLNRDEIADRFFSHLKRPIMAANSVLLRLVRNGHVRVDKKQLPYKYYSKQDFGRIKTEGYIYFIKEFHTNTIKIGKAKNIEERTRIFNVKLPFEWELIHSIKVVDYSEVEKKLHQHFKNKRIENSEWFILNDKDLQQVYSNSYPFDLNKYLISEVAN